MRSSPSTHVLAILLAITLSPIRAEVTINEVVSSNGATIADEDGEYSDWIELHNGGGEAVNLEGWGLTDDPSQPFKWICPGFTLGAGEYLLIWASGKNRTDAAGPLHTGFSVSASGETLALTDALGVGKDMIVVPPLPSDVSYGRKPDQGTGTFYFEAATPGAANTTDGYEELMEPPEFSSPGGYRAAEFSLSLSARPGWVVYYTLDGSDPSPSRTGASALPYRETRPYEAPLAIASRAGQPNVFSAIPTTAIVPSWLPPWAPPAGEVFKATVVRAISFDPVSGRSSAAVTHTYFVDPGMFQRYPGMPVISLVSDHVNLFDDATGIYVPGVTHGGDRLAQNFQYDWERPASVEYFSPSGVREFGGDYEIRNQGATSRASPQKGLHVIARDELGTESVPYPLFAGTESQAKDFTSFKRFIIRSWGSALKYPAFFSDAYNQTLAASSGLEIQEYCPAVVFINGEYWGLHEIRESNKNSWYHQARTGIDRDDPGYDLIDGAGSETDEGDSIHWDETMAFFTSHDMVDNANYDEIASRIDVRNFAEYIIHCVYCGKRDWPDQNEAKWRPRTVDGKWRWTQFDMDHGLNDFGKPEYDLLAQALYGGGGYGPHPLLYKLLDNSRFRILFANTYADWLNSRFLSQVELSRFDAMKSRLEPFVAEYDQRWPNMHDWAGVPFARAIVQRRNGIRRGQLRSDLGLGAERAVTLLADPAKGLIRCNSILVNGQTPGVSGNPYPWTGTYFQGIPVTTVAVPEAGFRFAGWKVMVNGISQPPLPGSTAPYYSTADSLTLSLAAATSFEAVFEPVPPVERITLHRWDFNIPANLLAPAFTIGSGQLSVIPANETMSGEASQGFPDSHLRINNPVGTSVRWQVPTTSHENITVSFLTRRSGSGAGTQTLSYTLDGSAWSVLSSYAVQDQNPQAKVFDFAGIPGVSGNPQFGVKVEFSPTGGGSAGNNRFDDFTVAGSRIPGADLPPVLTQTFSNRQIIAGGTSLELNLADFIADPDGDPVVWSVLSSSGAVTATMAGNTLHLAGVNAGEATVTVVASSGMLAPVTADFRVLVHPAAFPVASGMFEFSRWNTNEPAGSYPPHMLFLQSEVSDPGPEEPLERAYAIPAADAASAADVDFPYAAASRSRINGLGERGISFINTGRGRDVGGAILALDTSGQTGVEIRWTAGTESPNNRVYGLTPQYRLVPGAPWTDLPAIPAPVSYVTQPVAGQEQSFDRIRLPAGLENQPYVQIQWRYCFLSGTSGSRAQLRLDDIAVYKAETYQEWAEVNFPPGTEGVSSPGTDFRGDGYKNLLKYAFGATPGEGIGSGHFAASIQEDGSILTRFARDRRRSDIVYRVEASADLSDWSDRVFDSGAIWVPNSDGDFHEVIVPAAGSRKFVRVAVIQR